MSAANPMALKGQVPQDQFANLPREMKQAKRWLLWRDRKHPYYVTGRSRSGSLDSPEDLKNLGSFAEAVTVLAGGGYSGLGFALGPDETGNCWQGVDLDKLSAHPELMPLIKTHPGYTEKSPSGDGVHVIGYGRPFPNMGSNKTGVEAYCRGRFFTVTGDSLGGRIRDIADWVEADIAPIHHPSDRAERSEPRPNQIHHCQYELDEAVLRDLESALGILPADDYDTWIKIGLALSTTGDAGRRLWLAWSAKSEKYVQSETERKWSTFRPTQTSYKVVFQLAQDMGWQNPAASRHLVRSNETSPTAFPVGLAARLVDLDDVCNVLPEHPHIVERIFPRGEVALLAGHGGSGKSFVALAIGIHVCLGIPVGELKTNRGGVLFFSAEDGKDELLRRTAAICLQIGRQIEDLKGLLHLLDASEMDACLYGSATQKRGRMTPLADELAVVADRCQATFIVVDNASDTYDAEENVRADVRSFIRGLRQKLAIPNRAVLLLAHVNKLSAEHAGGRNYTQDYSGSTAWHNSSRSRLSLEEVRGSLSLVHKKANRGPLAGPIGVSWVGGVPLIAGLGFESGDFPGAELLRQTQEKQRHAQAAAVLRIIQDFTGRGEMVRAAASGRHTTYALLRTVEGYPKGLDKVGLSNVIRDLERQGKVRREVVRSATRKPLGVLVAETGEEASSAE
jgi:AAA domain/Primase C terminal 2 (PriCT-2)